MTRISERPLRCCALLAAAAVSLPANGAANLSCDAKSISGGNAELCVIREDGRLACWGDEAGNVPPFSPRGDGTFEQVSVGEFYACGVRTDSTVTCWGKVYYRPFPAPQGPFQEVSVTYPHVWGLRPDGTVVSIYAHPSFPAPVPPSGTFLDIEGVCGRRADFTVDCWVGDWSPEGTFQQLSGACGLRTDGSIACDEGFNVLVGPAPAGVFTRISADYPFLDDPGACAIRQDGTVVCWGSFEGMAPAGTFREIETGYGRPCGIRTDGAVVCVPDNFDDPDHRNVGPVVGTFTHVAAGGDTAARPISCAIEESGEVACWGNDQFGQTSPPPGSFTQLSAGNYHVCGLHSDATIQCWGVHDALKDLEAPSGTFTQVSSGSLGPNCALRSNGHVECWGFGETDLDVPDGRYVQVTAGGRRACVLNADGDPTCWQYVYGNNQQDIVAQSIDAPDGPFTQLSASGEFSMESFLICGLRTDGSIECWGDDVIGLLDAPEGEFVQVSTGGGGACGLSSSGTIHCWGGAWREGGYQPPQGEFVQVATGYRHACGLTSDGSVVCAGEDQSVSFCEASSLCGNGVVDEGEGCDDAEVAFAVGNVCTDSCDAVPCGQPVRWDAPGPVASDALFSLHAAVGLENCDLRVCDVDDSGGISVVDALRILSRAVALPVSFDCPS